MPLPLSLITIPPYSLEVEGLAVEGDGSGLLVWIVSVAVVLGLIWAVWLLERLGEGEDPPS